MTSAFGGQRSIQLSYGCSRLTAGAHHRQAGLRRQWLGQASLLTLTLSSPGRRGDEAGAACVPPAPRAYARSQASGASVPSHGFLTIPRCSDTWLYNN